MITVTNTSKFYQEQGSKTTVHALDNVSFSVKKNEIVSIIGPSGCGKTTLLKMVAGLVKADGGQITVGDRIVKRPGPELAMVFQDFALLPWATVLDNIAFGLTLRHTSKQEKMEIAQSLVDKVGLSGFEKHYPRQLSGGMQQRVGLARALAVKPSVLLMDEPFSSLDEQTRRILQEELLTIFDTTNLTVMIVTHSIDEAILLGDRVILMSKSPGQIAENIDVPIPRPRPEDVDRHPGFYETRAYLWQKLRDLQ